VEEDSCRSAIHTSELTCQAANQEPGVESHEELDKIVDSAGTDDASFDHSDSALHQIEPSGDLDTENKAQCIEVSIQSDQNQEAVDDRLSVSPQPLQVLTKTLPPLFIESASNFPSSSPTLDNNTTNTNLLYAVGSTSPTTLTKEFGKSDSMDSAFEATEEVDEDVIGAAEDNLNQTSDGGVDGEEERRVHIQIIDVDTTTTTPSPGVDSPGTPLRAMGKLCDNMPGGVTKLSCDMTAPQSAKLQQILP
jgi:hypothetical protein